MECRNKNAFAISICPQGHATLFLGRSSVHLEIEELKALVEAAQEVLANHQKGREEFPEFFNSQMSH